MNTQSNTTNTRAYRLYLWHSGIMACLYTVFGTVFMIYQITVVGLTPFQLVLIGTALEVGVLLFEIPTGIVADVYSRRLSVIIGVLLNGVALVGMGLLPSFWGLVVTNILWGISYTFFSGALEAWFVDEVGQGRAENGFMRSSQIGQFVGLVSILPGIVLGSIAVSLPFIVSGALMVAWGVVLILIMPENGFTAKPKAEREGWRDMYRTLRTGYQLVRGRRALTGLMIVGVVWGAASEGFDRLWEAFLINTFTIPDFGIGNPVVVWFGLVGAVVSILSIIITEQLRRRTEAAPDRRIVLWLFAITLALAVGMFALGIAPTFALAMVAYMVARLSRAVAIPLFQVFANRNIDGEVRATVLSMYGQADAVGQMAGGPGVGAIGNASLRLAMVACSVLVLPALPTYLRLNRAEASVTVVSGD